MNVPTLLKEWNRWHPLADAERNEFEDLYYDFWTPRVERRAQKSFLPACEIEEKKDHYEVKVEAPGLRKEDLQIEIKDQKLVVSGERKTEKSEDQEGQRYTEIRYGKFERVFSLPKNIQSEQVEAQFENGVLKLKLPKSEVQSARKIEII